MSYTSSLRGAPLKRLHSLAVAGMLLADISSASDEQAQIDAVERIEDQKTLLDVARTDPRENVRAAAISRLSDPGAADEFFDSESWVVRKAAVARTSSKVLRIEAALDDRDPYV